MLVFKIIYGFDAIVALIIFYFFFVGIGDGTVSGFNIIAWLIILGALTGILWGSIWLKSHNYSVLAFITLLVLAVPAFLFALYCLIAITGNGRWN